MVWLLPFVPVFVATPPALAPDLPPPLPIVGGTEAAECQFPATVVVIEGDETPTMCSGTLIHPQVVLTAGHCIIDDRPIVGLGFGETGLLDAMPDRIVEPLDCVRHPGYEARGYPDLGYCTLTEAVHDVPITPLLAGCEVEMLEDGLPVTIVGFGATYGYVSDKTGEIEAEGAGLKRFIDQEIHEIQEAGGWVGVSAGEPAASACFGDSGGTPYVQLPDGSWRVFGAASQLFDPGVRGQPRPADNVCGSGASYAVASWEIEWYESSTGFDLTPCWDDSGEWSPGPDCGEAPMSPHVAAGTWETGCAGGPSIAPSDSCSEVGGTGTGDSGSDDSGVDEDSSSGDTGVADTGSVDGTTGSASGADTSGGLGSTSGAPVGGSDTGQARGTGSDGAAADDEDSSGCGCHATRSTPLGWLLVLLGLPWARRRSPSG